MTQYHFQDESGDFGVSLLPGSSRHLVIVMLQLAERAPLARLADLRKQLHLTPTFEFKFYQSTAPQKAAFFQALQPLPFRLRAVIVDKARLNPSVRQQRGQALLVERLAELTLRASAVEIANDILVMDGATLSVLRALRIRLSAECRRTERVRPFRKMVSGDSAREDGLQVADMVAGALHHWVTEGEEKYVGMFASKFADLWRTPSEGQ